MQIFYTLRAMFPSNFGNSAFHLAYWGRYRLAWSICSNTNWKCYVWKL